jgi:hypothetical protein
MAKTRPRSTGAWYAARPPWNWLAPRAAAAVSVLVWGQDIPSV